MIETPKRQMPLGLVLAVLALAALSSFLSWNVIRQRNQVSSAVFQTRVFENARASCVDPIEPALAAKWLELVVNFQPRGPRPDVGSQLNEIVESNRKYAIRDIIRYLRAKTGNDLGEDPNPWIEVYAGLSPQELETFKPIAEAIRRASSLTVYEGLPHPDFESELFDKERAEKTTLQRHGSWFYQSPLSVADSDVDELRKLSTDADSYATLAGPKLCGGFHPDFYLSWNDDSGAYELLICFGCDEIIVFGSSQKMHLNLDANGEFKALLKKYRRQRPEWD